MRSPLLIHCLSFTVSSSFHHSLRFSSSKRRSCGSTPINSHTVKDDDWPFSSTGCLSRSEASNLIDTVILPSKAKGSRLQLSSLGSPSAFNRVISGKDPALYETYGEFPLSSLDLLLDRAAQYVQPSNCPDDRITVIDLGSGCGRLALYMALSRPSWDVIGIEISPALHDEALCAVERAVGTGFLKRNENCLVTVPPPSPPPIADPQYPLAKEPSMKSIPSSFSRLSLLAGSANELSDMLIKADLIFCYSTAFASSGFSEPISAMILGNEWNDLLTKCCCANRNVCLTTDKALDPKLGWRILEQTDVSNPEVFESTCYIQRLEVKSNR